MVKKYARDVMEEGVLVKDLKVLKLKNAMHAMGIKYAQGVVEKEKFERRSCQLNYSFLFPGHRED
jgi:hypothetical protein